MDLSAIRKRLNQLQTTNNRTSSLWKPQPGKTQIRIVPYELNKDNPFIELFFHYNLNNRSYLSPISFGRPDPIEEFAQKLRASGNKEDYQLSRKLEAKMRTFAPVVVRGEEKQGVKFWGFGKTVYQELLSIIADPDYGDITDPVNGRDVVVEFLSAEETGASFPKTNIRVKPNQTAVSDEPEILELVKKQQDIRDIYQEQSYDDLTEILNEWLNPDEKSSEEDTSEKTVSTPQLETSKVSNTADAFDDLFNS
ncbi:hypothetical protein HOE22_07045 [Candidatus Woesearchaeota archaeon]|nr:hypothetical protein [Candidatus Woesearchaeota archaeon]